MNNTHSISIADDLVLLLEHHFPWLSEFLPSRSAAAKSEQVSLLSQILIPRPAERRVDSSDIASPYPCNRFHSPYSKALPL